MKSNFLSNEQIYKMIEVIAKEQLKEMGVQLDEKDLHKLIAETVKNIQDATPGQSISLSDFKNPTMRMKFGLAVAATYMKTLDPKFEFNFNLLLDPDAPANEMKKELSKLFNALHQHSPELAKKIAKFCNDLAEKVPEQEFDAPKPTPNPKSPNDPEYGVGIYDDAGNVIELLPCCDKDAAKAVISISEMLCSGIFNDEREKFEDEGFLKNVNAGMSESDELRNIHGIRPEPPQG